MMKGFSVCLLVMAVAVTAYAGTDAFVVAKVEDDLLRKRNVVFAPAVSETYEYYEVNGCSEEDLRCDLKKKCITWKDGRKYDSVTNWKVKWVYDYSRTPQTCTADSFQVNVEVIFRYPKWVQDGAAPRQLVEKWDAYMNKLVEHENEHRNIVVEAADELTRAVAELPVTRSCAELDRLVHSLCRTRMDKLVEDQKNYDITTNHGVVQGALFP